MKITTISLAVLFLLSVPGTAQAERQPTQRERAAIEKAARRAYADRYFRVRVSRIEVSTVDRQWATAVVATFHRREPHASVDQRMQEWFYRSGQGWVAWFSVAWPDVEMPIEVERDLGFAGPPPLFGISWDTAVKVGLAVIALILLVVVSNWLRDPEDEIVVIRFRRPRR